ncbi:helix-turn-helix transcriptional regulator [Lachnospiraceae bacterium 29-84]
MDYITLGKNVRKYRLIFGFSQEELAGKCDCSNSHIGQIENARGIPSLDMVVRIVNSLSVTVNQLRGESYF